MDTLIELQSPSSNRIYEAMNGNMVSEEVSAYLLNVSSKTKEILGTTRGIENELDTHDIRILKPFFMQFPNAWHDLKRKLHKYVEFGIQSKGTKKWFIS